ncbi:MAG TPA: hypothetical protein DCM08_07085 [Microscillaceae bacterium]|jgi:hypothetical protein|nr:hypothetical protein [Microscillaceae bacterium]
MKKDFGFFKTTMPASRKADIYLGCLDGAVFIDFNLSQKGQIALCRISFDNYGCCNLPKPYHFVSAELSKQFLEEIAKDTLDQEKLASLVKEIIQINHPHIWEDALAQYQLVD